MTKILTIEEAKKLDSFFEYENQGWYEYKDETGYHLIIPVKKGFKDVFEGLNVKNFILLPNFNFLYLDTENRYHLVKSGKSNFENGIDVLSGKNITEINLSDSKNIKIKDPETNEWKDISEFLK